MNAEGYSISRVIVNKPGNRMMIFIKCGSSAATIERAKEDIMSRFAHCGKLEASIIQSGTYDNLEQLVGRRWNDLKEIWKLNFPACSHWLDGCYYRVEHNKLKIVFDNEMAFYTLRSKGLDRMTELFIKAIGGMTAYVALDWEDADCTAQHEKSMEIEKMEAEKQEVIRLLNGAGQADKAGRKDLGGIVMGKAIKEQPVAISQVVQDAGQAVIEGDVFMVETKEINSQKYSGLVSIFVTDYSDSIEVRVFVDKNSRKNPEELVSVGDRIRIKGECQYNKFAKETVIIGKSIVKIPKARRMDNEPEKRVELHAHTKFSAMDGIAGVEALIAKAEEWGHSALAITDHGVIQAFPEAYQAAKKTNIKVIYGVEAYMVNDCIETYSGDGSRSLDDDVVVVDIETTGLDPKKDGITEIGAVKIHNGNVIERFHSLVNPEMPIPKNITQLTGIDDHMVRNSPTIDAVLPAFLAFADGCIISAHNASFDMGFIKEKAGRLGLELKATVVDTVGLSRLLFPELKSHKLNIVSKHLGIRLVDHHRATDDATAAAQILIKCFEILKSKGLRRLKDIDQIGMQNMSLNGLKPYHMTILARNRQGLKDLYRLISRSHLEHFYKTPRIPRSLMQKYRDGLLVGSACQAGELFKAVLEGTPDDRLESIASFYDYLEIQPLDNNRFLIDNGTVKDIESLQRINKKICYLGHRLGKPVVATGDVHFVEPEDEAFRRVIMAGKGFDDADNQAPLFLKTTTEMLHEFAYLGEDLCRKVVIENPLLISDMIDSLVPIPQKTYAPKIEGAEDELRSITLERAVKAYGSPLPTVVKDRLDRELKAIIENGYAVMYITAQRLVSKSLQDGYLVGSRGSVGSSLVATMSGITEVNPLPPHYLCGHCNECIFVTDGSVGTGIDLIDRDCPRCGSRMDKLGFDILFEVFMGFSGDKEPDIDLNFSGEYQSTAHRYTEELFGKDHVFRAGTIATLADKTAYGFVKKYIEDKGLTVHNAEINRLIKGCEGIKRTTGQHPGGVMIVPAGMDIYEFTAVQRPADDTSTDVITTHFDYHALSGRLLKLDILGHDDPTVLKMLHEITGLDPRDIPLDDPQTMGIFSSVEPLGIDAKQIDCTVGSLGIPEFGTKFVRQMLEDTRPTTFEELVRISGLSHGTDVWLNNAQDLIRNGTATLREVISARDDIMIFLMQKGLEPGHAFSIMERVRKGKGLEQRDIDAMKSIGVPDWFIDSCKKIKYLFPKAHAVAYVTMAFRIAYYKVHHPLAFYAAYFTVRADEFDANLIVKGKDQVDSAIREYDGRKNNMTQKEKSLLTILEIAREMYCRGFGLLPVDLYKSDCSKFIVTGNNLLPPLNSLQGLGRSAAEGIMEARRMGPFISIEDMQQRTRVSRAVIDILKEHGCLDGLPDTNQISLF
jgi:DNA polymerase-3 subunit alpha (Gram-positive type)